MKTGTPPRVAAKSVDRSKTIRVAGDVAPRAFSFRSRQERFPRLPQVDCLLTHTTERTHDLIRRNLDRSPLYSGRHPGRGPRYCPSIEDKVVRFPERERHQIFVEPEGLDTDWTYLSGLSMSLPADVQEEVVRSLPGLERAEILRPAYAVEYDVVFPGAARRHPRGAGPPRALPRRADQRHVRLRGGGRAGARGGGERGARGEGAGAAPFTLGRHEAYIGVMIDDLVTLGAEEPYRLLTSRAEHRLLLGADTAYARLTEKGARVRASRRGGGRADPGAGGAAAGGARRRSRRARVLPDRGTLAELEALGVGLSEETTGAGLLRRPDAPGCRSGAGSRDGFAEPLGGLDDEEWERLVNEIRYEGFLKREREVIERVRRAADRPVPAGLPLHGRAGLVGRGRREAGAAPAPDAGAGRPDPRRDAGSRDAPARPARVPAERRASS